MLAAGRELVAPGEFGAIEPAARGELPFRFGRQFLAGPLCVGERVGEGHVHDRMIVERVDVAPWPVRMPPVRALHERPPLAVVAKVDRMIGRTERQRARIDHVRKDARIVLRIGRHLGEGDVTGRFDELLELPVGHRRAVHPEIVDRHAMNRSFFRIVPVRSHAERSTGDEDHAGVLLTFAARPRVELPLGVSIRDSHCDIDVCHGILTRALQALAQ